MKYKVDVVRIRENSITLNGWALRDGFMVQSPLFVKFEFVVMWMYIL